MASDGPSSSSNALLSLEASPPLSKKPRPRPKKRKLLPKTDPLYQPTTDDLMEIRTKMLSMEDIFRPYEWDEALWSEFKASNDFSKIVPYHLFAGGLFEPEHRHILNHYRWVPLYWPGPEVEHLQKQSGWNEWEHKLKASQKFQRHRKKRNKHVRRYLDACSEVAEALGVSRKELHPGGDAADGINLDELFTRFDAAVVDDVHEWLQHRIPETDSPAGQSSHPQDFTAQLLSALSAAASQSSTQDDDELSEISDGDGESHIDMDDAELLQEWCMDDATVDYIKQFTSLLLASGCAMNALLTYNGGCKMIANIQAVCVFVGTKTDNLAVQELWGWLASVMKVSSATENLLRQLQLLTQPNYGNKASVHDRHSCTRLATKA